MNSVELFSKAPVAGVVAESLPVATKTATNGAVTVGYVTRKAYGELKGLKGSALDRAHLAYRVELGFTGNANLAAALTGGELLVQSRKVLASGIVRVDFVRADKLGVSKPVSAKETAKQLSDEELLAILAERKTIVNPVAIAA